MQSYFAEKYGMLNRKMQTFLRRPSLYPLKGLVKEPKLPNNLSMFYNSE